MICIKNNWHRIALLLIMLLTGFLTFYAIGNEGYANQYYAAAVKSMLTSWHNFFFASLDPGGYVTVDKPALGLWLQTASAYIFGFHGWSIILPEALSTITSVALIYKIVQRFFGKTAGVISALVLGLTPILIAVSRTNNLDASLVMVLLFATWMLIVAAEKGSLKLLVLSMVLVGIGFNIKMLQAFMVLPAFYLVYIFTSPKRILKRLLHLTVATAVLITVSLSWAVIVDLTPLANRPYIGSSQTNSVIELALGYNGIQRVTGNNGNNGGNQGKSDGNINENQTSGITPPPGGNILGRYDGNFGGPRRNMSGSDFNRGPRGQGGFGGNGGGGPGGTGENGQKGVFRIFDKQIAGQISWLLPMALFGILTLILRAFKNDESEKRKVVRYLIFLTGCIAPMLVFFSIGGFFHRYYLSMMAPGIAALTGIGIIEMWTFYIGRGYKWIVLPISIIVSAALQSFILWRYSGWREFLIPIVCAISILSVMSLVLMRYLKKDNLVKTIKFSIAAGVAALLLTPAIWAATPLIYGSQTQLPIAGPELKSSDNGGMNNTNGPDVKTTGKDTESSKLVQFLISKRKNERYLVAVPDVGTAESIVLKTGQPVMAIGGFSGSDKILTIEKLKQMVKNGELRYFEIGGRGMGTQSEISNWVIKNGKEISSNEWTGVSSTTIKNNTANAQNNFQQFGGNMDNNVTLYDLAPEKG